MLNRVGEKQHPSATHNLNPVHSSILSSAPISHFCNIAINLSHLTRTNTFCKSKRLLHTVFYLFLEIVRQCFSAVPQYLSIPCTVRPNSTALEQYFDPAFIECYGNYFISKPLIRMGYQHNKLDVNFRQIHWSLARK